jgi:hypothetical protein
MARVADARRETKPTLQRCSAQLRKEVSARTARAEHLVSPSCRASMRRASLSVQPVMSIISTLD